MSWIVVKFSETDEVEALPHKWLIEEGLVSYPPISYNKQKLERAIKTQEDPSENWQTFSVELMSTKTYNTLAKASGKASKACFVSDISERENYLPPKRQIKKKCVSSTEDEDDSGDSLSDFPIHPKYLINNGHKDSPFHSQSQESPASISSVKNQRTGSVTDPIVTNNHSNSQDLLSGPNRASSTPLSRRNHRMGNDFTDPIVLTNHSNSQDLPVASGTLSKKTHRTGNDFSESSLSSASEGYQKNEDEFQRTILTYLIKIQKILKENENELRAVKFIAENNSVLLSRLLEVNNKQDNLVEIHTDGITQVLNQLPIDSSNNFDEVNALLSSNQELFKHFVNFLARLGGSDYKESIKRMFQRILTNNLMEQYSLYGHKGKKIFRETKFFEAMTEATHEIDKKCTTKEIELRVSAYLAKSTERIKIKNKKTATDDVQ